MNEDQNDHEERCSIDEASPEIHESSVSVYRQIIVVILLCAINGGVRFCAQNIVPLQDVITENMRLTEVQYNAISSFYSIPNIFLLIIMGFAVDKLGHQLFTVIFTVCCLCGQTLICLGIRQNMYYLLMSGRLMFGLGSESLQISLTKYSVVWFSGSYLTIVLSLQMATASITSFISVYFSRSIFLTVSQKWPNLQTLDVAALVIAISAITSFIAHVLSYITWFIDKKSPIQDGLQDVAQSEASDEPIPLNSCRNFSPTFWALCIFCFLFYLPFSSYVSISPLYYELKYGYTPSAANATISLSNVLSIFFVLIFGFVIGKSGVEIAWYMIGTLICLNAHLIHSLTFIFPHFIVISRALGVALINCSFWPVIKYVTPSSSISLGFGIILSLQNLGLSVASFMIAIILDHLGYFYLELALQVCFSTTFLCCFALYWIDKLYTNGVLSMTLSEKISFFTQPKFSLVDDLDQDDSF